MIVTVSLICWFAIKPVPTLIQGEVEVKSIKISSKLAGRIEQMDVKEGQQVKKGELLFVLSTPEVEALNCVRSRRPATRPARQSAKASRGAPHPGDRGSAEYVEKSAGGGRTGPEKFRPGEKSIRVGSRSRPKIRRGAGKPESDADDRIGR